MSYREDQRKKATSMRDELFRDPGAGLFFKKEREFVLQDATLNLWAGIRDDAIEYFKENSIAWWMGDENTEPTGHLLSSQVACLNHLYFVRQRKDAATAILKNICEGIDQAVPFDNGFVAFEVIGDDNYLNERSHTRGANATSVDAVMVGKKKPGSKVLFLSNGNIPRNTEKRTNTYLRDMRSMILYWRTRTALSTWKITAHCIMNRFISS